MAVIPDMRGGAALAGWSCLAPSPKRALDTTRPRPATRSSCSVAGWAYRFNKMRWAMCGPSTRGRMSGSSASRQHQRMATMLMLMMSLDCRECVWHDAYPRSCWDNGWRRARSYHAMTSVGDEYVAVFGGCGTEGRLNDLHLYHAPTNRWVEIKVRTMRASPFSSRRKSTDRQEPGCVCVCVKAANAPSVRGGAALACTRSHTLVLFGGFDGSELGDLHLLALPAELAQLFDGATSSAATALAWEAVSTVAAGGTRAPGPRSVAGMCAIGGERVVLFGGELDASPDGHAGAGHFTAESFVFDAAQRTWSSATTQSYHHDAASGTEADDGEGPCARGWLTIAPVARPRDDADVLAADVLAADVLVVGGLHASNRRLSDAFVLELRGV